MRTREPARSALHRGGASERVDGTVATPTHPTRAARARQESLTRRLASWGVALALPLALVILLRTAQKLDARWEVDPVHFWIVLAAGVANGGLAVAISEAGRRRRDARLLLIGLAFLVSAGFLGLHALATPNVVVDGGSAAFVLATPIGLVLAGAFAAASAIEYGLDASLRIVRRARLMDA